MTGDEGKTALIMLGCPQVPVQTSAAIYLAYRLKRSGVRAVIAGTPSARKLVQLADPEGHYIGSVEDLDKCIAGMAEGKKTYHSSFVFIHNDAGVSYAATTAAISGGQVYPVIFGSEAEALAAAIEFPCTKIVAPATHNPMPLKRKIDEVMGWDA